MAMFEPTKGLVAIACDECATTKILVADVLHVDKETYEGIVNGEIEFKGKVEGDRVIFYVEETTTEETPE